MITDNIKDIFNKAAKKNENLLEKLFQYFQKLN